MFDNSLEKVRVDKTLLSSSFVLPAVMCKMNLKIHSQQLVKYDLVMVSKLHYKEYEKVPIYKLHADEYGKYPMKGRYKDGVEDRYDGNKSPNTFQLGEQELYQDYKGMVHEVIKVNEFSFKDEVSLMIILLSLVYRSNNIRGCKLFNSKLQRNFVMCDDEGEAMYYKLPEEKRLELNLEAATKLERPVNLQTAEPNLYQDLLLVKEFMKVVQVSPDVSMIVKFGIMLYPDYLVADKVIESETTRHKDNKQYVWESQTEYLEERHIKYLIKKNSKFSNYPIDLGEAKIVEEEKLTPFKVLCGRDPILVSRVGKGQSPLDSVEVGEMVYVKLQPYRQHSSARHPYEKFVAKYYVPFLVTKKNGMVANELDLRETRKLYFVFHVLRLKSSIGTKPVSPIIPPHLSAELELVVKPEAVLKVRQAKDGLKVRPEALIKWKSLPFYLKHQFPLLHLEDKVGFCDEGIVTRYNNVLKKERRGKEVNMELRSTNIKRQNGN
ncbi:hypothetical protein AgCh_032309 [Apium graveolens]